MGRGRQKAKDAKIARKLKYASHTQDISALERELVTPAQDSPSEQSTETDDYYDRWATDDTEDEK